MQNQLNKLNKNKMNVIWGLVSFTYRHLYIDGLYSDKKYCLENNT